MTETSEPLSDPPIPDRPLRKGWTTGATACAAARAAFALLNGAPLLPSAEIILPKNLRPSLPIAGGDSGNDETGPWAKAWAIKDAGDDPDVTHGAEISVRLSPGEAGTGLTFQAGEGVGTVTRPGLPIPVGEPAINPGPRQQITETLRDANGSQTPDLVVRISIKNGAALAEKTLNGRLGIVGGLSVLGTTGVVTPYSCSAWVHSIHRGVDVARALGLNQVAAATGRTSETLIQKRLNLPEQALIEMGDFAGGLLKYLKKHPVPHLALSGGFAKMAKLGQGQMDLHSSRSRLDMQGLAQWAKESGADAALTQAVAEAATGAQALALCQDQGVDLAPAVARAALAVAQKVAGPETAITVLVCDRQGQVLADV